MSIMDLEAIGITRDGEPVCSWVMEDDTTCGRKPRSSVVIWNLRGGGSVRYARCWLHDHSPALRELAAKGELQVVPFTRYAL